MDNKTLLIAGGLVLLYFTMSKKKSGGQKFYVSPYGWVDESQLPSLGYTNVGGTWYGSGQISYAYGQAGVPAGTTVNYGTSDWYAVMQILQTLAGLTTTIIQQVTTVTQKLQKKYKFLKYITIHNSFYSEDDDIAIVSSEINSIDPEKIGKAIDNILREVYDHLDNEAGLYFINEFKEYIGDEYVEKIQSFGVNFDRIQSDQNKLNINQENKITKTKKEFEEKTDKRKTKSNNQKKDDSILNYT